MKKLRKISRKYYLRQIVSCWLVFSMLIVMPAQVALANPNPADGALPGGESVVAGSVDNFNRATLDELHIEGIADGTIINWVNHDIGVDAWTEYDFTIDGSRAMSRVTEGSVTGIMGKMTANGPVFLINPAGIVFGSGAVINVPQLVASSLTLTDADFLDGGSYTFTGGAGAGDVINNSTDTITADSLIALIGKTVLNTGTLVVEEGYVVMAAGETVTISEVGSNIAVVVLPLPEADISDYTVDHTGGSINAQHVILAAGDIWSSALIDADGAGSASVTMTAQGDIDIDGKIDVDATAGSDAVATVEIVAAGDVDINEKIEVEAEVDSGVATDNAIATITIDAGGDVDIYKDVKATADAKNGSGNATASTTIDAGENVYTDGKKVEAKATADHGSGDATATVDIDAGGTVDIDYGLDDTIKADATTKDGSGDATANVYITADEGDVGIGDKVEAKAKATDSGISAAGIDIDAGGSVYIDDNVEATAETKNPKEGSPFTATAGIDIDAGGSVEIYGKKVIAKATNNSDTKIDDDEMLDEEGVIDLTLEGLVATATVDITANGDVEIIGNSKAEVRAIALNKVKIKLENLESDDITVNATAQDLTANADVDITATNGYVDIIGDEGEAIVEASAHNEIELEIKGDKLASEGEFTVNATVAGLQNNAGVTIFAGGEGEEGGVYIEGYGDKKGKAEVSAKAKNIFKIKGEEDDNDAAVNLTVEDLANTATVDITAENGDVEIIGEDDGDKGEAKVGAGADNELELGKDVDGDFDVALTVEGVIDNTAGITIDAAGDIRIVAEGDEGKSKVEAEAANKFKKNAEYGDLVLTMDAIANNTATVDITAGEDVKVIGKWGGEASIAAETEWATDNTSEVTIATEDGDVVVHGIDGDASVEARAAGADNSNTATIDIDAVGGDVKVIDIGHGGDGTASIEAIAEDALNSNTADITITATATTETFTEDVHGVLLTFVEVEGGNVEVIAKDGGSAKITAIAKNAEGGEVVKDEDELPVSGPSNTANVKITATGAEETDFKMVEKPVYEEEVLIVPAVFEARTNTEGGNVKVEALGYGSGPDSEASIKAVTVKGFSNDSDVLICAEGDVQVVGGTRDDERGNAEILALAHIGHLNDAYVGINAGGILDVLSYRGEASIESMAFRGYSNTAYTLICAEDVSVEAFKRSTAKITADASDGKLNTADIDIISSGDVRVRARNRSDAKIRATAEDGDENNAHVGIWADGDVIVRGRLDGGVAKIEAKALDGDDNDAEVTVVAGGDIKVTAVNSGEARIQATAKDGSNLNTAYVGLWADGDVIVAGYGEEGEGGDASIIAEAIGGIENFAKIAVCAEGDVVVASGFNPEDLDIEAGIPEGTGGSATIKAEAEADGYFYGDEADDVRTSADAEVSVVSHSGGVAVIDIAGEGEPRTALIEAKAHGAYYNDSYVGVSAGGDLGDEENPFYEEGLGVLVAAIGDGSKAYIKAFAWDGIENTADTVVCTPGSVEVWSEEGGWAAIGPWALGGELNLATAQIYASELWVSDGAYVGAVTSGGAVWITDWSPGDDVPPSDGGATLIIDSFGNAVDCPTCDERPLRPDCPICDEVEALFAPTAPLVPFELPRIEGCPHLMQAAAFELGTTPETIQVAIGNSLALNPSIQPCQACATLITAASLLRDADGSRMAAMIQTFNALAPADAPFTPEMATSIATSLGTAADGTQYASVADYVDAFVLYVAVLDADLGAPVGDSVAFVMEKYGTGLTGNAAAFVATRLETMETF